MLEVEKLLKQEIKRIRKIQMEQINTLHELYIGKKGRISKKLKKGINSILKSKDNAQIA